MEEIPFTLKDTDFLQENLDFSDVNPADFEKLVYHLIDEMGFSNICWRKGGEGNSATDGGRDLEATFWSVLPSGSKEEMYWFEVKHRTNQLEKQQVQSTILNAAGNNEKDNLVIVTNKTISNPTLDWVKDFQKTHKNPNIVIWQGHDLELLLRKNPRTLARFLPTSLAFGGRCKVIESKFSNLMLLPAGGELDELWNHRNEFYENSYLGLIASISEVSYGDIEKHPWGLEFDNSWIFAVVATGMLNVLGFIIKCGSLNREQHILIEGLSYLTQCLLIRCGAELTAQVLYEPERFAEKDYSFPADICKMRYEPIFKTMFHDLAKCCSSKYCLKLSYGARSDEPDYFLRFLSKDSKHAVDDRFLIMNSLDRECGIGIVPKNEYCPLGKSDEVPGSIEELQAQLEFARNVILSRAGELVKDA
jgi:hypothetical protein